MAPRCWSFRRSFFHLLLRRVQQQAEGRGGVLEARMGLGCRHQVETAVVVGVAVDSCTPAEPCGAMLPQTDAEAWHPASAANGLAIWSACGEVPKGRRHRFGFGTNEPPEADASQSGVAAPLGLCRRTPYGRAVAEASQGLGQPGPTSGAEKKGR